MKIQDAKEVWQEAVFIQEKEIEHDMVRVLVGYVKGSLEQWRRIKCHQQQLEVNFYF